MKKTFGILFIVFAFVLGILSDYHKEHPRMNIIVLAAFLNFLFGIYLLMTSGFKEPRYIIKYRKNNFPTYPNQKHYNEMNRNEKRKYKKWLAKNDIWDGAVVIENLEKNHRLKVEK